jgi:hypothetical protein
VAAIGGPNQAFTFSNDRMLAYVVNPDVIGRVSSFGSIVEATNRR